MNEKKKKRKINARKVVEDETEEEVTPQRWLGYRSLASPRDVTSCLSLTQPESRPQDSTLLLLPAKMQFCRIYARHAPPSPVLPPPTSLGDRSGTRGTLPMRTHKLLCPSSWNYASIHRVTRIVLIAHRSRCLCLAQGCTNVK